MRGLAPVRRLLGVLVVLLALGASSATAQAATTRYSIVNECVGLKSKAQNRVAAGPFRMQATALGKYLLYDRNRQFFSRTANGGVGPRAQPSEEGNWRVDDAGGGFFRIALPARNAFLRAAGGGLGLGAGSGDAALFSFSPGSGCPVYPEVDTNVSGAPSRGKTPFGEVGGFLEGHMHMMAFEFLGGRAHCGRPWHPYGAPSALVDCPDHYPANGAAAVLENVLFGNPARTHDPVGWPNFKDWPHHESLTHEQSYYKWLERSWRSGQRIFVNLFVENKVLCEIYPYKQNSCDEMTSVRRQNQDIRALENYIDAQSGGPGKGWFRIVTNPFEARRVINQGKLAVVLGIEVSEPFGCRVYNEQPQCSRADIDRELNEVYGFGVRQMEIINKFDNALAGVAGDTGTTGAVVNSGNRLETGKYWQMQACTGPPDESDKQQPGVYDHDHNDLLTNALEQFVPLGVAPVYPRDANCNVRGLTDLGEHAIRRMVDKGMIVDPDHLSVRARKGVMNILEAERHGGVISSHTWSTPDVIPRIYKLGGIVTPYAGAAKDFVTAWKQTKPKRDNRFFFGFGYGADMNGFGSQGGPRNGPNPVRYPFKSWDGKQTIDRGRSGNRVWDINRDGVAQYGLYPDWIEDLRKQAGNEIVSDMARGSEAYLQMWERSVGVPGEHCRSSLGRFSRRGAGRFRLGEGHLRLLRRLGQPDRRANRTWSYCVRKKRNAKAKFSAVMTKGGKVAFLGTTAFKQPIKGVGRGAKVKRVKRKAKAKKVAKGLYVRKAGKGVRYVWGIRKGRVRFVAVASRSAAKTRRTLRAYTRLAGLR